MLALVSLLVFDYGYEHHGFDKNLIYPRHGQRLGGPQASFSKPNIIKAFSKFRLFFPNSHFKIFIEGSHASKTNAIIHLFPNLHCGRRSHRCVSQWRGAAPNPSSILQSHLFGLRWRLAGLQTPTLLRSSVHLEILAGGSYAS